jgi:diguanylate cyclase (GGDEF)-like protein
MWPWLNNYPWVRRGLLTLLLAVPVVMAAELQGTEYAAWLILALPALWGALSLVSVVTGGVLLVSAQLLFLYAHLRGPADPHLNVWLECFALLLGWGVIGIFRHRLSREERTHREYLFSLEERLVLAREQYKSDLVITVTNQKKVQKYFLLNRVSRVFGTQLELPKLMDVVIKELRDVIGAERGRYLAAYVPADGKNALLLALPGEATEESVLEDQFGIWAVQHRTVLLVTDVQKDFRFRLDAPQSPMRSLMIAPFLAENGRVAGLLRAESIYPGMFTGDDARLLTILADLAGAAAENARLYQWTQELSITDGLTRLYLRRFFNQRLEEEIARFQEFKAPFTLLILDLDHFKRINDKMGHLGGDQVLMQLAEVLRGEARVTDILCRYGGEEFALLLPYTPSQSGLIMAERIRQHVAQKPFAVLQDNLAITVSIGVAGCPEHGQTAEGMIAAADQALYLAKREGRNRVVLFGGGE